MRSPSGLPYFLLSTTSPLLQAWFARRFHHAAPYRLFALSNLASLLALLAYPVAIEPWVSTATQSISWSVIYALFALLCGYAAIVERTPCRRRRAGAPWRPLGAMRLP